MSKKYEARISMLVQSHLTTLIESQLNDPRVQGVKVTDVEVTADTRFARVYYSVLGSAEDKEKAARGLDSAAGWLSKELGRRLRTKRTPHLTFKFDESLERGERMGQLLDEVKARENAARENAARENAAREAELAASQAASEQPSPRIGCEPPPVNQNSQEGEQPLSQ
jgi:ribosome-binding factor A